MGHVDEGAFDLVVQTLEFRAHSDAQFGVEIAQGFIEQEARGFAYNGAAQCDARTTIRRMYSVSVTAHETEPLVCFEVTGNAFMRHMVRIMAGTLLEVGRGRYTADDVSALLESGDRTQSGPTAPAAGLTLIKVHFDSYPKIDSPLG